MTEILTIKKIRNKARAMKLREQRFQRFLDEKKKERELIARVIMQSDSLIGTEINTGAR